MNRISAIEIETEDVHLKRMLAGIAQEIRRLVGTKLTQKMHLQGIPMGPVSARTLAMNGSRDISLLPKVYRNR